MRTSLNWTAKKFRILGDDFFVSPIERETEKYDFPLNSDSMVDDDRKKWWRRVFAGFVTNVSKVLKVILRTEWDVNERYLKY